MKPNVNDVMPCQPNSSYVKLHEVSNKKNMLGVEYVFETHIEYKRMTFLKHQLWHVQYLRY